MFDLHQQLAQRGFNQLWLEAGASLSAAFVEAGLVDELIIYQAAKLIGASGRSLLELANFESMAEVEQLAFNDVRMVGADLRLRLCLSS